MLYVLDYATRYLRVHTAPTPTECVTWFLDNLSRFERHARSTILGELISDNGPEFLSHYFRDVLMARGIEHTLSVAHELVLNGAIERTIKTVTKMARRSLAAAALPARLWPFAVRHCAYLLNRIPHAALDHRSSFSPFAALYNKHPRLHHTLPFGVLIYFKVLPPPSKVQAQHASLGVFLGFHPNVDALFVWDPVYDRTVFALSVRILAGRTFANFSESLPGTGILSTDATPSFTLPTDTLATSSPSPPLASPPIFDCIIPACSACALNDAYLI